MHRKQNTPKYGNIAQLGSPVVNFCARHAEDSFHVHEHNHTRKSVLIPLLNAQEAKYWNSSTLFET
jgi:hypothetical protein